MARSISAASVLPEWMTSSKACSAAPVQLPGVVEGLDLGLAVGSLRPLEQHVVARVRVEGRVEIDQVDRLVGDGLAQRPQIVAVIEMVHVPALVLGTGDNAAVRGSRGRCVGTMRAPMSRP
jgi:hypothetical protein